MSAIYGLVTLDGGPIERAAVARMAAAVPHHGDRDAGTWTSDAVGMGCRLRAVSPRDRCEQQPVRTADGGVVLVADARLYGRSLAELGDAIDVPDSQRLLDAYLRWGAACVQHLDGTFAFAVWDGRSHSFFAARSAIAAPALLYWRDGARLAFATVPGALHASGLVARELDATQLVAHMTGLGHETGGSIYKGIRTLPLGSTLVATGDATTVRPFWTPDLTRTLRLRHDDDYVEAFRDVFDRVVADHLDSDSPVSLLLSGGLDSSAIALSADPQVARRGQRLTAFTEVPRAGFEDVGVRGFYADESARVQEIAARLPSLDLRLVRTDGQIFLDDLPAVFEAMEMPFRNTSNLVWMAAAARASAAAGRTTLLDGLQGNITFSFAGGEWLTSLMAQRRYGAAARQLRRHAGAVGAHRAIRSALSQLVMPVMPSAVVRALSDVRARYRPASFSFYPLAPVHPALAQTLRLDELAREQAQTERHVRKHSREVRYDALMAQDFGAYLSGFRALAGVDMRSPTADPRVAEFCLSLPEEQFCLDGESRSFARRLLAGRLPDSVVRNRQRGMQAADWYERLSHARPQVEQQLADIDSSPLAREVLDLPRMRALADRLEPGPLPPTADHWGFHWTLQHGLMVGAFLRWFETRR